jgi:arylsulfatase A-like enzyme
VFYGAGVRAGTSPGGAIRSVDILPTVLAELGIRPTQRMDGRAFTVPGR